MNLASLRPADATATGIATALTRAQVAQAETTEAVTAAKARRDTLLLDGTPADLATAEKALTAARDTAERVDAVTAQLVERHATATRAEALAAVEKARADAEAAGMAFVRWHTQQVPVLHAAIAEGQRLQGEISSAVTDWDALRRRASERYPDASTPAPQYADPHDASGWEYSLCLLLSA